MPRKPRARSTARRPSAQHRRKRSKVRPKRAPRRPSARAGAQKQSGSAPAGGGARAAAASKTSRPARRPLHEADRLQDELRSLRQRLREVRRAAEQWHEAAARVPALEAEIRALRREIGPQRPLFPVSASAGAVPERWLPEVVEAHLTALNDHDPARAAELFGGNGSAVDGAGALPAASGREAVGAFHRRLFQRWGDFRYFPRAWHNLRSAAFLEGDASFVLRAPEAERLGAGVSGSRAASIDMMLVYDVASHGGVDRIARFKVYYDGGALLALVKRPPEQGSLF